MVGRSVGSCFVALVVTVFAPTAHVHAQAKSVVTIVGGEARTPSYELLEAGLRQTLDASGFGAVDYYLEYLDDARFPSAEQERALAEYLRKRYADKHIDALVAFDPATLRFLEKYRDQAYPGVPVVFGAVHGPTIAAMKLPPDFIGAPVQLEAGLTIGMALALRPGTREIVFITGGGELARAWLETIHATPIPPGVRLRILSDSTIEAIDREVAALGSDAIVLVASFRRDAAGRTFLGNAALVERLAGLSAAPVFALYDVGVGRGAVGTFTTPQATVGAQAGLVATQLLAGKPVAAVTMPLPAAPVPIVDWRELKRWGMDEARLPVGADVRFRQPGFWEQYRYHAIAVAVLVLLESALVAGLLLQRKLRRGVEDRLRQSEQKMQLAANAAQLVMWDWDIGRDEITMADGHVHPARAIPSGARDLEKFLSIIHPDDRDAVRRALESAIAGEGTYESEYRVVGDDGVTRWFAGRGRVEKGGGAPPRLRGVTLDVTIRKSAEIDAHRQRNELAHLSRITLLGELSVSMAHELNQPLMAILSNAQAARMFIAHETVDLVEVGAILDDIIENDKRAGEIIWGMRKMLKKEDAAREDLPVNDVVQDVLRLMRSDLMNRGVVVEVSLAEAAGAIRGDRMQLQQVLVNLILNACDAMASMPKGERVLVVRTESAGDGVRVSVADRGTGIPPESLAGIFTPFFTTKKHGLGLGLSVCSSIIAAHGGELRATNNPQRGATLSFVLPARAEAFA